MKLAELQREFTAMIRQGDNPIFNGIEARRLQIYQKLFFNNVEGLLANGFPVIRKILGPDCWKALVYDFWQQHRCQTPYFPRLGSEFVSWLQSARHSVLVDYPFLIELAHYEYMEVVVDLADEELPPATMVTTITDQTILQVNPAAVLLHYHFPVHRISPDYLPTQPSAITTHLVVYRNCQQQVKFMELTPATAHVLQVLQAQPLMKITLVSQLGLPGLQLAALDELLRQLVGAEVIFLNQGALKV